MATKCAGDHCKAFQDNDWKRWCVHQSVFAKITARSQIGTRNTAVLRVINGDVEISGLTTRNDYACDRAGAAPTHDTPDAKGRFAVGQNQAVALMLDQVDHIKVSNCVMSSFPDTRYLRSDPNRLSRALFETCHIARNVRFIFGGTSASFHEALMIHGTIVAKSVDRW